MLPSYSGSGRWRITILQISMARGDPHPGNQTQLTAEEIKQLKTFDSLIENDVITRQENKESGKYGRKWLPPVSASSHQFTQP